MASLTQFKLVTLAYAMDGAFSMDVPNPTARPKWMFWDGEAKSGQPAALNFLLNEGYIERVGEYDPKKTRIDFQITADGRECLKINGFGTH